MKSGSARDEKTLDIGAALGASVLVLVVGHLLLWLAGGSFGLGDDAAAEYSSVVVLLACFTAVAYLMRAGRRWATGGGRSVTDRSK